MVAIQPRQEYATVLRPHLTPAVRAGERITDAIHATPRPTDGCICLCLKSGRLWHYILNIGSHVLPVKGKLYGD